MLLHGFTGSAEVWLTPTASLDSGSFIAPDLLGHGRTVSNDSPERYAMPHAAADLIALLDQLRVERVLLHGYSMGGRLALFTALTYPDRVMAVCLESASPGLVSQDERAKRAAEDAALAERIMTDGIAAFVSHWEQTPLFRHQTVTVPEPIRLRQRAIRLLQREEGLAASLRGMGTGSQPSLWGRLEELTMPVQLITGSRDIKFAAIADAMSSHIRNCRHLSVPEAGHAVHVEAPRAWQTALGEFINSVSSPRV